MTELYHVEWLDNVGLTVHVNTDEAEATQRAGAESERWGQAVVFGPDGAALVFEQGQIVPNT